jgi:hypothetical protein
MGLSSTETNSVKYDTSRLKRQTIMNQDDKDNEPISPIDPVEYLGEEVAEWIFMTPEQRWAESTKLWSYYLSMGGSLDPEPDSRPFL